MKQQHAGHKVINWHRPLAPGSLTRRCVRARIEEFDAIDESWEECPLFCLKPDDSLIMFEEGYPYATDDFDLVFLEAGRFARESWSARPAFTPPPSPSVGAASPGIDTRPTAGVVSRMANFVAAIRWANKPEPLSRFNALFEDACRTRRRQIAFLWQQVAQIMPDAEPTIGTISAFSPFWIRNPQDWSPPATDSITELTLSLVDHLFVRYPVPRFLYNSWTCASEDSRFKWLCWFIILGQGGSLYRAGKLIGWRVPKDLASFLHKVPEDLPPREGCMFAEATRLGGNEVDFRRLASDLGFLWDTTSRTSKAIHVSFWRETVRWLARHRDELSDDTAGVVLRWAMHMFTEAQRGGQSFSWKKRTVRATRQAAEAYMNRIQQYVAPCSWKSHGWDWELRDGQTTWTIRELLTSEALRQEGQTMHHCVGGYANGCLNNSAAIFSVCQDGNRAVTVEVSPEAQQIVQVGGVWNRSATQTEQTVVHRWWREVVRPADRGSDDCHATDQRQKQGLNNPDNSLAPSPRPGGSQKYPSLPRGRNKVNLRPTPS